VVGGGPGGSSLAALLSRSSASTLVLDKAVFPRDKVCGDGLTPRALYWLDILGCADEVIAASRSYLTEADLFVDGKHVLTGTYSDSGTYPGFCIILKRKALDHIMIRYAVSCGAALRPNCVAKQLRWEPDGVVVEAVCDHAPVEFKAKIVVGADGANSMVSRALGNEIMEGVTAVSMRGYFEGAKINGPGMPVYFEEPYCPGYGWIFADDDGVANIGVGLAVDRDFPSRGSLRQIYAGFVGHRLQDALRGARQVGEPKGGWSSFFRPGRMVADGVVLIGDAANLGDPMNGGGIHMAMESAHIAAPVILQALQEKDFSAASLGRYVSAWEKMNELDWRVGELFLTIGKNSPLRDYWIYVLKVIAGLAKNDPALKEFVGGLFSGTTKSRSTISPAHWMQVAPANPGTWLSAMAFAPDSGVGRRVPEAAAASQLALKGAREVLQRPLPTLGWMVQVLTRLAEVTDSYVRNELPMAVNTPGPWVSRPVTAAVSGAGKQT
jgi:geranylgeranyl reductase family protein